MFKKIKDYPNYVIHDNGLVQNIKSGRFLHPMFFGNGYLRVGLSKDGEQRHFLIHRLVAEAFLPNPDNLPIVNHKDGNPSNNNVSNLEWCSQEYNAQYKTETTKRGPKPRTDIPPKEPKPKIGQYNLNNELLYEYDSIKAAAEALGSTAFQANISKCLHHKPHYHTAYGYRWEYLPGPKNS